MPAKVLLARKVAVLTLSIQLEPCLVDLSFPTILPEHLQSWLSSVTANANKLMSTVPRHVPCKGVVALIVRTRRDLLWVRSNGVQDTVWPRI